MSVGVPDAAAVVVAAVVSAVESAAEDAPVVGAAVVVEVVLPPQPASIPIVMVDAKRTDTTFFINHTSYKIVFCHMQHMPVDCIIIIS